MKITCLKSNLMNGINIALRAVPSKTTMPILESFLITAQDDIRITSNDNDMGIRTEIEGIVNEPGRIAVEARLFSEIIRKLPDNEVFIESLDHYRIRITCEELVFQISGNDPDEFPELPETGSTRKIHISEFTLKEMIRQTIFSIAVNDSNMLMKGELFSIKGDNLKVVSLDSHRISIRNEKLPVSYESSDVIVPGKTLNEISRILSGNLEDMVEIEFDKRFIKFSFNGTLVISRLIEGEFFDVERMISSDYSTEVRINKNDFMNDIDRAITLTREGDKKPVILEIRDSFINMDINSTIGSMSDRIPASKTGNDLVIGFNPKFFMDALRVIDDEEVAMYFVNSNAPCFIRNDAGDYVYIILPVNINR
ncbi:MAG: DNA polymerase III subunit beta [Parasporobacterium sp.]|nr:DNA polymerase III subunit beta [Parasporobacterium sp.]